MSSPTRASVLTAFLPLAPTTSASYPTHPAVLIKAPVETPAAPATVAELAVEAAEQKRRSSSVSSALSASGVAQAGQQRFLKLGPIHHGIQTGDWSEL